jgi:hypothetical protein
MLRPPFRSLSLGTIEIVVDESSQTPFHFEKMKKAVILREMDQAELELVKQKYPLLTNEQLLR